MNQILMFRTDDGSKKQIKKVVRFFSFLILVFGIILIAEGVIGYIKTKNNKSSIDTPKIVIEKAVDKTILNISSNIGISQVKYYWNIMSEGIDGNIVEESLSGNKEGKIEIQNLNGTNALNIEILDNEGNIIKYEPIIIAYNENGSDQDNWEIAIANDKTKPTIKLEAVNGKIRAIVSDNLKMSYVVYKWNDEDESTITGLTDDEKQVIFELDALEGENKLTIKAYDRAGNEASMEKTVQGVKGPVVKVVREDDQIVVNVEDEEKITKIVYDFNGQETTIDNITEKTYEIRLDLVDGVNYIILDAYKDDIKSTYKGKTTKEQ